MVDYSNDKLWQLTERLDEIAIPLVMRIKTKNKEFVFSIQFLRSSSSIGANTAEARVAQTRKDFIMKMCIARKECSEALSWTKRLLIANLISNEEKMLCENVLTQIMKILNATIVTARKNT